MGTVVIEAAETRVPQPAGPRGEQFRQAIDPLDGEAIRSHRARRGRDRPHFQPTDRIVTIAVADAGALNESASLIGRNPDVLMQVQKLSLIHI